METGQLMEQWRNGRQIFRDGGSYHAYLAATPNLRADPAVRYFAGDLTSTREAYESDQKAYLRDPAQYEIDPRTMSVIRVKGFDGMLAALDVDVLALFGERDTNVDWRRARALNESTIGRNPDATLRIRTFPDCNHSMRVSGTGLVREVEGTPLDAGVKCQGYYEAQIDWLREYVLAK